MILLVLVGRARSNNLHFQNRSESFIQFISDGNFLPNIYIFLFSVLKTIYNLYLLSSEFKDSEGIFE